MMIRILEIYRRISRKWMHMRLQPIHVYCLHHVCERFDAESMHECDWMALDEFKQKVLAMQQSGVEFISLREAHQRCKMEYVRCKRYAVLTFDDGYASLKEVLPWLKEQGIPCTLFINGKYMDGNSYRNMPSGTFLTWCDIKELLYDGMTIAHHGAEHVDVSDMSSVSLHEFVELDIQNLKDNSNYIPFWAYTWGRHSLESDGILREYGITPVLIDGMKNYNNYLCIHRELMDKL